jgi:hypothetical protein
MNRSRRSLSAKEVGTMSSMFKQWVTHGRNGVFWLPLMFAGMFLVLTTSCLEDPVSVDPPVARIAASPWSGRAPLRVYFTDESGGKVTSRLWKFHNGETSSKREVSFLYAEDGSHPVTLTVAGPDGSDSKTVYINVLPGHPSVTLANLRVKFDNSAQRVSMYVDVNFKQYAGQPRVLGLYWLRSCGGTFCFQKSDCGSNAPDDILGRLRVLTPYGDNVDFNGVGASFPYSCFPDRSTGATYYAYACVYNRVDINAVTNVNDPSLAIIGPPSTIVPIRWQ